MHQIYIYNVWTYKYQIDNIKYQTNDKTISKVAQQALDWHHEKFSYQWNMFRYMLIIFHTLKVSVKLISYQTCKHPRCSKKCNFSAKHLANKAMRTFQILLQIELSKKIHNAKCFSLLLIVMSDTCPMSTTLDTNWKNHFIYLQNAWNQGYYNHLLGMHYRI